MSKMSIIALGVSLEAHIYIREFRIFYHLFSGQPGS
jgi:hypothetical protein